MWEKMWKYENNKKMNKWNIWIINNMIIIMKRSINNEKWE